MKYASIGIVVAAIIGITLGFQNCSGYKTKNFEVDTSSTDVPSDQNPGDNPPGEDPGDTPPPTNTCDSTTQKYFLSVMELLNADEDLTETAPQIGPKIATMKLDEGTSALNPFQGEALAAGVGWRISTVRVSNSDGTAKTVNFFTKWDENNSSEKLNCYFGPVMPMTDSLCQNPADPPVAKMFFENMGVGLNGVNGYIGYLSCPPKYIACKVIGSSKEVQFVNKLGEDLRIPASKPFIVKRGCGT